MGELTKRDEAQVAAPASTGMPVLPDLPPLSAELLLAIDVALEPMERTEATDGGTRRVPRARPKLWPDDMDEARAAQAALQALFAGPPATAQLAALWLAPIAVGVEFPPDQGRVVDVAKALAFALGDDAPAALLNTETQREAMRRFDRFPSVAKLLDLLEQPRNLWRRHLQGLRIVTATWGEG